jgi:phosphoglycerate kinase
LPKDFVTGDKFEESAKTAVRDDKQGIEDGWMGLDIGPKSIEENSKVIMNSKTIFWNGPQGVFEMKPFAHGSLKMLDDVIKASEKGVTTVVGGGDTVNLVKK